MENQSLNNLPNSLKYLILDFNYEKPLNNLPNSIIYLKLYDTSNLSLAKINRKYNHHCFT